MSYLFILDSGHLDNGPFLKVFSKQLGSLNLPPSVFIHGDSEYTDRIMQTGFMRDEARIRAVKELNHRLIALFADEGVACVGLNPYQRGLLTTDENDEITTDTTFLNGLLEHTHVMLSNLTSDKVSDDTNLMPLGNLAAVLDEALDFDAVIAISKNETGPGSDIFVNGNKNAENKLPDELENSPISFTVISMKDLNSLEVFNRRISS